jgi:hypothetical protein
MCVVLAAAALVVPRFVPNQEGGFASAASAILAFLAILFVAALLSLYLLAITLKARQDLAPLAKAAGIAPAVLLVGALVFLIAFLQY